MVGMTIPTRESGLHIPGFDRGCSCRRRRRRSGRRYRFDGRRTCRRRRGRRYQLAMLFMRAGGEHHHREQDRKRTIHTVWIDYGMTGCRHRSNRARIPSGGRLLSFGSSMSRALGSGVPGRFSIRTNAVDGFVRLSLNWMAFPGRNCEAVIVGHLQPFAAGTAEFRTPVYSPARTPRWLSYPTNARHTIHDFSQSGNRTRRRKTSKLLRSIRSSRRE